MKTNKVIGAYLIAVPVLLFLIAAAINGFSTTHCWVGSCGMDKALGFVGIIVVIVGITLCFAKDNKDKK